jgi:hypothetical protein
MDIQKMLKAGIMSAVLSVSAVHAADIITMDVDSSVRSGTYQCESIKQCWTLVQYAEERGANQWCNNISIKKNGRIVWSKNYWPDNRTESLPFTNY